MEIWKAIVIAIVQGFTEWFPVSSKGHLILVERILGFSGGLDFDVVLHLGTLMAVFVYFGKDIVDITKALATGKFRSDEGKLGIYDLFVLAIGFAVTGVLLLISSFNYSSKKSLSNFGSGRAFLVGMAQVFALFPGISRSGTTISAGLLAGLKEQDALRFSFLMSIPVIFGANVLVLGNEKIPVDYLAPMLVSFVVGLIAIHLLYKKVLTHKKNLRWFAAYALVLAIGLFIFLFSQ